MMGSGNIGAFDISMFKPHHCVVKYVVHSCLMPCSVSEHITKHADVV